MKIDYPQYSNGMFKLKKGDFDDISFSILEEYFPNTLLAASEFDILFFIKECLFLNVKSKNLSPDKSVLGLIAFENTIIPCYDLSYNKTQMSLDAGDIVIDLSLSGNSFIQRRRFTLAHEASHWILHRSFHSPLNQKYEFRKPYNLSFGANIERNYLKPATENDIEEWQANSLAAALLMPKDTFLNVTNNILKQRHGCDQDYISCSDECYDELLERITATFNVSRQAAEIRMINLNIIRKF